MVTDNALKRIFSRDKTIESRLLNVLGVQVARTLMARAVYRLRPSLHPEHAGELEILRRDGLLVIPDFLPAEVFEQVRQEATAILRDSTQRAVKTVGPNTIEFVDVNRHSDVLPNIRTFFDDARLRALLQGAERRKVEGYGVRKLERLVQGPPADAHDPETDLHSDIFYPVHKCWLYLTDVTADSAPFVYVKGSHHLSATQLRYLYQESCDANIGSRRVSIEELADLGLAETVVTCKMNTLVIANTLGYHRRATGSPGAQRIALHESLRSRPFSLR